MKFVSQLISFPNYFTAVAILLLCLGCTAAQKTAGLQNGMTREQVITTLERQPAVVSSTPDGIEILTFSYPQMTQNPYTGQLTATRVPFHVYLQDGRTIAWGKVRHDLAPDAIIEHHVTGTTTNLHRLDPARPTPPAKPTSKPDTRT